MASSDKLPLDQHAVERANLLNVAKLAIKGLIESSMASGNSSLDETHPPLKQFFVVMEHVLQHGLKVRRNLLGQKRSFFSVAESLERFLPQSSEMLQSVRNMPTLRTALGRSRAWLRFVVMQKQLADYCRTLCDHPDILSEWYEPYALIASEDATVIVGMLVGVNVLDCNLDLRERAESLDTETAVIDVTKYLKEGNYLIKSGEESGANGPGSNEAEMAVLRDQKAYLEELNTKLRQTSTETQAKLDAANRCSAKLQAELDDTVAQANRLREQYESLQEEVRSRSSTFDQKLEDVRADMDTERQTYAMSRRGLDEMYTAAQKQLESEIQMREDLERELEMQKTMKSECETAMQLMERDIHEKQDTVLLLRRQLDDVKQANLTINQRLQDSAKLAEEKTARVEALTASHAHMAEETERLNASSSSWEQRAGAAEDTVQELSSRLAELEAKKTVSETDLMIERQWRSSIQTELQRERDKLGAATQELEELRVARQRYEELQRSHADLQETLACQEQTLVEMGGTLQRSKEEAEEMREKSDQLRQSAWADDKHVTSCTQCGAGFSVARRRHHCRQCGGIFCATCSDNQMQLAASAKPVRVCDRCYTLLLQPSAKKI